MTPGEFFALLKQGAIISFNGSSALYPLHYKKAIKYYERIGEGKWKKVNSQLLKDVAAQLLSQRVNYGFSIDYSRVTNKQVKEFLE